MDDSQTVTFEKNRNEIIKGDTLSFIVQMMGLSYSLPKLISMDKALN